MEYELRKLTGPPPPPPLQISNQEKIDRRMQLSALPTELVTEIFTWLPVSSLMRFRCVSKWFKALISSHDFVKAHLRRRKALSKTKPNQVDRMVRGRWYNLGMLLTCSLDSFYGDRAIEYVLQPSPEPGIIYRVVGACDGILCIAIGFSDYEFGMDRERREVILWNPSIRTWYKFQCLKECDRVMDIAVGFGYDSQLDDYKVVRVWMDPNEGKTRVEVCSLRTKQWRSIEDFKYGFPEDFGGKFLAGCLHWQVRTGDGTGPYLGRAIVSLDLATETYNKLMIPGSENAISFWRLCVIDDHLCVLLSCFGGLCSYELWMMKEYGVRESWTKLLSIGDEFRCITRVVHNPKPFHTPLYVLDSDRILFHDSDQQMVICNHKDNTVKFPIPRLTDSLSHDIHIYMETLVSPTAG